MSKWHPRATMWLTLGLVTAVAACGSGDGSGASAVRHRRRLPERLSTIEAAAEDIIDIVPNKHWGDITQDVRDIDTAWSRYMHQAVVDGARASIVRGLDQALVRLQDAADRTNGPGTEQAANDLSAATVELYGLYDIGRPVAIGRLDVIGRQIILDVQRGAPAAAGAQVRKVVSIWNGGLRDDILAHHGRTVADKTGRILGAMGQAVANDDGDALITRAKVFLEVVDAMEKLY